MDDSRIMLLLRPNPGIDIQLARAEVQPAQLHLCKACAYDEDSAELYAGGATA